MGKSLSLAALACAVLAPLGASQSTDPFALQTRWTLAAASNSAWIPSGVEFAAAGELVWAAGQGSAPRLVALETTPLPDLAAVAPTFQSTLSAPFGVVSVATGDDESALFTIAQYVTSDTSHRRTEIARYDAHGLAAGAYFPPVWRHNMGLVGNGTSKLAAARDGSRVVCVTHDALFQMLDLEWLDTTTGSALTSRIGWSATLRQMAASADVRRVAVVVGAELRIYDELASVVYAETLATSTNALALSADGHTLAVGSGATLRVLSDQSGSWNLERTLSSAPGEIVSRVGVSDDGRTLAAGWWNAQAVQAVRLEVWDTSNGVRAYERFFAGSGGTLQNFVENAVVSRDGRRAAFGLWGSGDAAPEVVLVDRDSASELLAVDLGGSVRALALDPTGTRVAVGFKHVHANQFGTTGSIRLFDTGERDVQLIEPPRAGQLAHVAAHMPGARQVMFVLGARSSGTPFLGGTLSVSRTQIQRMVRMADASGRADLHWTLSPFAAQLDLAVQAVARIPGAGLRLSSNFVAPVVF